MAGGGAAFGKGHLEIPRTCCWPCEPAGRGVEVPASTGAAAVCLGEGFLGTGAGGRGSSITWRPPPTAPLCGRGSGFCAPMVVGLASHIIRSGGPACVSPQALLQALYTGGSLLVSLYFFFFIKKEEENVGFFFPYKKHKAWESEEGQVWRCQLWALACPLLRLPGHQVLTPSHHRGLRAHPFLGHTVSTVQARRWVLP